MEKFSDERKDKDIDHASFSYICYTANLKIFFFYNQNLPNDGHF